MAKANRTMEERLQALEDHDAIRQVLSGYGYSVDGLNYDSVADFYAEDGRYLVDDTLDFRVAPQSPGSPRKMATARWSPAASRTSHCPPTSSSKATRRPRPATR